MRHFILAVFVAGCVIPAVRAQTPATPAEQKAAGTTTAPPQTMTGCVQRTKGDDGIERFTLADETKHGFYELTGSDLHSFVDTRVKVTGEVKSDSPNRLHIVGGLYPTPNVAAQAGAIDPARAAIAAMPGGGSRGTGAEQPLEFKVGGIQKLKDNCE